jgi:hypothetical protein
MQMYVEATAVYKEVNCLSLYNHRLTLYLGTVFVPATKTHKNHEKITFTPATHNTCFYWS